MRLSGCANRLGNLEPFVPKGAALRELPHLGIAPRQQAREATAGAIPMPKRSWRRALEGRDGLSVAVDRPPIVALGMVGSAEAMVRQRLQDALPASRGERQRPLAGGDGLVIGPHDVEIE